jgi:hypothetical protein
VAGCEAILLQPSIIAFVRSLVKGAATEIQLCYPGKCLSCLDWSACLHVSSHTPLARQPAKDDTVALLAK